MAKNKRKFWVDTAAAIVELKSCDLEAEEFRNNGYQIRIRLPGGPMYDWYHTTGTLVRNDPERGPASCPGEHGTAESIISYIFNRDLK